MRTRTRCFDPSPITSPIPLHPPVTPIALASIHLRLASIWSHFSQIRLNFFEIKAPAGTIPPTTTRKTRWPTGCLNLRSTKYIEALPDAPPSSRTFSGHSSACNWNRGQPANETQIPKSKRHNAGFCHHSRKNMLMVCSSPEPADKV